MSDLVSMSLEEVHDLTTRILLGHGVSQDQARAIADTVTNAERDECPAHGLFRVPGYVKSVASGKVDARAAPEIRELAPAVIQGNADMTLLDVPDVLVALAKWPGKIKVIGPVSREQRMGVAFSRESPELKKAFDRFFEKLKKDGAYARMVKKYYPAVFGYWPDFFSGGE